MKPGDTIDDRFWLEGRHGSGGMGVVFRAVDLVSGARVAIKVLTRTAPDDVSRARREALALSVLAHPGIVSHVADGVTADGWLYLAMEWVEGPTLADRLDAEGLSLREAVSVARAVAAALAAAHDAGIVHRDVKPSNIVLVDNSLARAKLIDFGVARFTGGVTSLTRTGVVLGTPGYMAPEQVRGKRDPSPAADVFGLGCTLYEMLTGSYAFAAPHQIALLAKVLFSDPPPLAERCPEAPAALVAIVEGMLTKDPATRLGDASSVVAALDALGQLPDGQRRPTTPAPTVVDATSVDAHVMVIASRVHPDDGCEPPPPDVQRAIEQAIQPAGGTVVVLTTGAVVGHLSGPDPVVQMRAERFAAELASLLPEWSVVVSSAFADAGAAAEHGAHKLATAVMSAIFGGRR